MLFHPDSFPEMSSWKPMNLQHYQLHTSPRQSVSVVCISCTLGWFTAACNSFHFHSCFLPLHSTNLSWTLQWISCLPRWQPVDKASVFAGCKEGTGQPAGEQCHGSAGPWDDEDHLCDVFWSEKLQHAWQWAGRSWGWGSKPTELATLWPLPARCH